MTRKDWGHLPPEATLEDYHAIIKAVLTDDNARVWLYHHSGNVYPTVVTELGGAVWLVLFDLTGIMETAFVVEQPERYLGHSSFELLGMLSEVLA